MASKLLLIFLSAFIVSISIFSCNETKRNSFSPKRLVTDEGFARKRVKELLPNQRHITFYDTLVKTKAAAIAIAEPILFDGYGKANIEGQKPYEAYFVDGYWYIMGTLPENVKGGVFEIILDAETAKVVRLVHGQ